MFPLTFSVIVVILHLGPMSTLARPNQEPSLDVEMPQECNGKTFCFKKHENYPDQLIEKMLAQMKPNLWFENDTNVIVQRGSDRQQDCDITISNNPIHEIIDEKGMVRYVVQSDKRFKQILTVEECRKPGRLTEPTLHFTEFDLMNNILTCEEKRIQFSFLVLTPDFQGVELAKAKDGIPICCSCVYHRH